MHFRQRTNSNQLTYCRERSVLGPMLFLLCINEIAKGVASQMRICADDSIVYRQMHTPPDKLGGWVGG